MCDRKDITTVSLEAVPARDRIHAAAWLRRVVKPKWLPSDIESRMTALKDVGQLESRDKDGNLISQYVGDYIVGDYVISGYGFHIQDSGYMISVRVDFPQPQEVSANPSSFMRKYISDFFNVSSDSMSSVPLQISEDSSVYMAFNPDTMRILDYEAGRHWWENPRIYTEGQFFFAIFPEREPDTSPVAKPGLPDRF